MNRTNRLTSLFATKKQDILNIYVTAGYPRGEDTVRVVTDIARAGADIVELGMPYSDPLADGETIQESSRHALKQGLTLHNIFDMVRAIRRESEVPLVLMGYVNQVMQYGIEAFVAACVESGVDGLIIPDLPAEVYREEYHDLFTRANLGISFLVTPQTSSERISMLANLSSAFLYVVSSSAITGGTGGISPEQIAYFQSVAKHAGDTPKLIGFGISDKDTFATACSYAEGAIIGSAFIRELGKRGPGEAASFVRSILS
ncbi:tryptophan synthase subunit alpha [Chitinivibrio alkaliphilus]|uniref:Tryptophan synthase alpha chain n=1 Tax=Chitinivibrio alkaliphilus ACht1 TaxID=1313304 RepID=U7D7Z7_9BACT|nr:tryptophan synthase subunit alpha [Chitinivibrio alkaliphilus]ERP31696.1 tryptophan synthase, alpha subunit [Chitinivibrio alkaliphilus ACht1]